MKIIKNLMCNKIQNGVLHAYRIANLTPIPSKKKNTNWHFEFFNIKITSGKMAQSINTQKFIFNNRLKNYSWNFNVVIAYQTGIIDKSTIILYQGFGNARNYSLVATIGWKRILFILLWGWTLSPSLNYNQWAAIIWTKFSAQFIGQMSKFLSRMDLLDSDKVDTLYIYDNDEIVVSESFNALYFNTDRVIFA